jgi:hypothetical protein
MISPFGVVLAQKPRPDASTLDGSPTIPPLCGGAGTPSDSCYQLREFVS